MKRAILPLLALAACGQSPEAANNTAEPANATVAEATPAPKPRTPTERYADRTAAYNSYVRAAAALAAEKASRPAVKKYAAMVAKEQLAFGLRFKVATAKVRGLLANPTLSDEQQANLATLQKASGAAFDQAFVAQQVAAHQEMLPIQQGYAAAGEGEELKAFADYYGRWVQRHLRLGKEL